MRRLLNACAIAFSMYSRVPMPRVEWTPENLRCAFCFFPLVGGAAGAALWGWLWLCRRLGLSPALCAAVAVALPLLITGGIHMDGFCDTVDALAAHAPRDRRLEILKDPHAGAFAVMGCGIYLLLGFGLWSQYRFDPRSAGVLALGFAFSRALSALSVLTFRRARKNGLAVRFAQPAAGAAVPAVLLIEVFAVAFWMLRLSLLTGAACLLAALVVFIYYKWTAYRNFGGVTGDLAGYFLQLCELAMLAAAVLMGVLR